MVMFTYFSIGHTRDIREGDKNFKKIVNLVVFRNPVIAQPDFNL